MLTEGAGSFRRSESIASATMLETARLRNHLWFAGMTYHGECGERRAHWEAPVYKSTGAGSRGGLHLFQKCSLVAARARP
jgi:hypothetical protein